MKKRTFAFLLLRRMANRIAGGIHIWRDVWHFPFVCADRAQRARPQLPIDEIYEDGSIRLQKGMTVSGTPGNIAHNTYAQVVDRKQLCHQYVCGED